VCNLQSGYAYLIIDWDTLSEENRAIAKGCATRIVLPEEGDVYLYGQTVKERVIRVDPQPHYDGRGFITIAIPLH